MTKQNKQILEERVPTYIIVLYCILILIRFGGFSTGAPPADGAETLQFGGFSAGAPVGDDVEALGFHGF